MGPATRVSPDFSATDESASSGIVAVVPVGPDNDGKDTIDSLLLYLASPVHVLAIDDSGRPATRSALEQYGSAVTVLEPAGSGTRGGLWASLAGAYRHALAKHSFGAILRIDTDALVVGYGAERLALERFRRETALGLIGSYRVDCNGGRRDFAPPAKVIRREAGPRGLIAHPRRRRVLRRWVRDARTRGYQLGEHVLGAVNFQSRASVAEMDRRGYLEARVFGGSDVSEDHLFSLLTVASGFELGDHATGTLPMGVSWRGLPDSPENLLARGKLIVHSVKFFEDRSEESIRSFFAKRRARDREARPPQMPRGGAR